jgi:hypothetical protein
MAMRNPRGRANYEPNSWGPETGGPRESAESGLHELPRRGPGAEGAPAAGELRRPLQPGRPVLSQPDAGRAPAHRRRARLRAEQGRDPGDPRAGGLAPPQHQRRTWRTTWPPASASTRCRRRRRRPAKPIADLPDVAGAQHPPERPGFVRRAEARRAGRRRRGRRAAVRPEGGGDGGRCGDGSSSLQASAAWC